MSPAKVVAPEHRQALERIAQKQQIVAELIAGRLPLVEATARFRRAAGRGESGSGESWCLTVIGWARLALRDRPERADVVSARLEQELQSHLDRHGGVLLSA